MTDTLLFVFEGAKTEGNILNSLKKHFLDGTEDAHICVTYNTHIYALYKEVKDDGFLDIVEVLRTRDCNKDDLKDIQRDKVSQVFLFFDYDGHVPGASDEKLRELLQYFNEETDMGKLYVSYPMVEALKHLNSEVPFDTVCVDAKNNIHYKTVANKEGDPKLQRYADLKHNQWKYIISEHCKKLNHLILGLYKFPNELFPQDIIFKHQMDNHIIPSQQVAVLSAFPVFLVDYYGTDKLGELVK
ncbi:MAG: hypothetical protein QM504_12350 [Pseudomonadota bacterium]